MIFITAILHCKLYYTKLFVGSHIGHEYHSTKVVNPPRVVTLYCSELDTLNLEKNVISKECEFCEENNCTHTHKKHKFLTMYFYYNILYINDNNATCPCMYLYMCMN